MKQIQRILALSFFFFLLSGCSVLEKLVYRIDINQGNYVEEQAVAQLKQGMSKEQVRFVLGSPMLVENGYPDTWFYIYHHTPGHKKTIQKNLIVSFNDSGKLTDIQGDFEQSDTFYDSLN